MKNATLIKDNGKLRVYERDGWTISIWDGGAITMKKADEFIRVDHNKTNMKLMESFFEGNSGPQKDEKDVIRNFNKEALDIIQECKTFSIHSLDDKVVLDTHGKDAKFYRSKETGGMILGKSKKAGDYSHLLKQKMRYIISDFDGRFITLEEHSPVSLENIFKRQSEPMLSVH